MNPFKWFAGWSDQRRMEAAAKRVEIEQQLERERENRKKAIKERIEEVEAELWHRGFNNIKLYSSSEECENASFYAVSPNRRLIHVIVTHKGGITMQEVTQK